MAKPRPSMFIGSSSEGLSVAKAIQLNLDYACEVTLWSQGVFGLGQGTLEALVDRLGD
jgi:predicted nucleotide-binding protein